MTRCHCPWPFHGSLSSYPACTPGSAVTTSSNAPSAGSLCYYRCRPAKAHLWFSLASRPPPTPAPAQTRGWRRKQLRRLSGGAPSSRPSSEAPRPSHTSLPLGRSPAPPPASHPQVESLLPSHEREGALKADRPVPGGPRAGWPSPAPRPPHSAFPAVSCQAPCKGQPSLSGIPSPHCSHSHLSEPPAPPCISSAPPVLTRTRGLGSSSGENKEGPVSAPAPLQLWLHRLLPHLQSSLREGSGRLSFSPATPAGKHRALAGLGRDRGGLHSATASGNAASPSPPGLRRAPGTPG